MADKSGQTFALPRKSSLVAELFTTQEQRDEDKREKVQDIPLSEIDPFPDHPFQVRMDEAMQTMADSVKVVGIQTPAIVRQKDDDVQGEVRPEHLPAWAKEKAAAIQAEKSAAQQKKPKETEAR